MVMASQMKQLADANALSELKKLLSRCCSLAHYLPPAEHLTSVIRAQDVVPLLHVDEPPKPSISSRKKKRWVLALVYLKRSDHILRARLM